MDGVVFILFACMIAPPESGQAATGESSDLPFRDTAVELLPPFPRLPAIRPEGGFQGGISILPHVGAVSAESATVWVRLVGTGRFRVLYRTVGGVLKRSAWVSVAAEQDFAGIVTLRNLRPATDYEYAVEVDGGGSSPFRSFTSLNLPGQGIARVGFMADGRSELPTPVYGRLGDANLDMVLQIGDFDHRDPYDVGGLDPEAWWDMYRDLLGGEASGVDIQHLLLPTTPLWMMWDDHDYGSDNGFRELPYRDVARGAFAAYMGRELNQSGDFWTRISDGPLDIFLLDLRSDRDSFSKADGPDKTMIGASQWAWLKAQLSASTAPFKLIVSTVPFNPTTEKVDAWFAYEDERQRLLGWLEQEQIPNVFVVSADIHTGGAIDDGTNSGLPELNLPTTNMHGEHCTAPTCGSWSEGVYDGNDRIGYGVVDVRYSSGERRWVCTLSTLDESGRLRHSLRLLGPP
jgi:alkaline phosphatase D